MEMQAIFKLRFSFALHRSTTHMKPYQSIAKMMRIIVHLRRKTMHDLQFWVIVGFLPYSIQRKQAKDLQLIVLRAIFLCLSIRRHKGYCSWG